MAIKQMGLVFEEAEYNLIPNPKRTWVMELIRKNLGGVQEAENRYYFRVDGRVVSSTGSMPVVAARKLGLGSEVLLDWKTEEEAGKAGWLSTDVNPMEV